VSCAQPPTKALGVFPPLSAFTSMSRCHRYIVTLSCPRVKPTLCTSRIAYRAPLMAILHERAQLPTAPIVKVRHSRLPFGGA
jgi:hypothetical protein